MTRIQIRGQILRKNLASSKAFHSKVAHHFFNFEMPYPINFVNCSLHISVLWENSMSHVIESNGPPDFMTT